MAEEHQPAIAHQGIQNTIDYAQFRPLYEAINRGECDLVRNILGEKPEAINARITCFDETPLHVATIAGHLEIVEKLVEIMSEEDLDMQDFHGHTSLITAATYGRTKIAECIIRKNKNSVTIKDNEGQIPLTTACSSGAHKDMILYLYSVTPLEFLLEQNGNYGSLALCYFIESKLFDLALDLVRRCPHLTTIKNHQGAIPVKSLSLKATAFPSGCRFSFWQQWIYSCIRVQLPAFSSDIRVNISQTTQNEWENNREQGLCQFRGLGLNLLKLFGIKQIYDMKLMHEQVLEVLRCMSKEISTSNTKTGVLDALFQAANRGIVEFTIEMIKADFNFIIHSDTKGRDVFHYAIINRQEKIFSLLYGLDSRKARVVSCVDYFNNNKLHVVGKLAPSTQLDRISGAALQMQRELQWYKEVERIVIPSFREHRNKERELPHQVFTREHKDLVKKGEEWMKGTATSCTVVGALIITIMFAAAFTVPGGNDQNTGFPIFLDKKHKTLSHQFLMFIILDAISLFASSTSVLMFLGILTSRYAEDDFFKSLPTKLIIGLSTLFVSIAAMMVAFSIALLIMLKGQLQIAIPIVSLASIPVTLFAWLQFPLLREIFMSTYGPSIFDRKMKPWL